MLLSTKVINFNCEVITMNFDLNFDTGVSGGTLGDSDNEMNRTLAHFFTLFIEFISALRFIFNGFSF